MSTATIAGNGVGVLDRTRAVYANKLSGTPEAMYADLKSAVAYLPKKAQRVILRAARALHIPQAAGFTRRHISRLINFVGVKAFFVEMMTSRWGQSTIRGTIKAGAAIGRWALRTAWRALTFPVRFIPPARRGLERFDKAVASADAALTPNSGKTWGPLQTVHEGLGYFLSHERPGVKLVRATANASMLFNITRKVIPPGPWRVLAYGADLALVGLDLSRTFKNTRWAKRIWKQAVEPQVVSVTDGVATEATRITKEAATRDAARLRREADRVESQAMQEATKAHDEVLDTAAKEAEQMRAEADQMMAIAEQNAAAEAAKEETAAVQQASTGAKAATAVLEREQEPATPQPEEPPKPSAPASGPAVPPAMGGRTPSPGPSRGGNPQKGGQPPRPSSG